MIVRPAVKGDVDQIGAWTHETFDWGDYVGKSLPNWLDSDRYHIMVCALVDGTPVAVARAQMLSTAEAWLDAARVHPDHRRQGLGTALNRAGVKWAVDQGATVVRLAIEDNNIAAQKQVAALGYRHANTWLYGTQSVPKRKRLMREKRFTTAGSNEVEPAWIFWSNSELALAARDLLAEGWLWRRARLDDLADGARSGAFTQAASGWAIVHTLNTENTMDVGWLAASRTSLPEALEALVDLAVERRSQRIQIKIPEADWTQESLNRAGFSTKPILVYAKGIS